MLRHEGNHLSSCSERPGDSGVSFQTHFAPVVISDQSELGRGGEKRRGGTGGKMWRGERRREEGKIRERRGEEERGDGWMEGRTEGREEGKERRKAVSFTRVLVFYQVRKHNGRK